MGSNASPLTVTTPIGVFSFDAGTLSQIEEQADGGIEISVSAVDPSALSDAARELIGTRPVYDFTVTSGGRTISDFGGGTVTISLPYTPADGEDPDKIVIYYVSDSGELVAVRTAYMIPKPISPAQRQRLCCKGLLKM